MASCTHHMPSPSPSVFDQEELLPPSQKAHTSRTNMLNIQALLNPTSSNNFHLNSTTEAGSAPPTPASTETPSSYVTSRPGTPAVASAACRHQFEDTTALTRQNINGSAKYPPHELKEDANDLSSSQKQELAHQHKRFQVVPYSENVDDLISNYTRRIPYSSEKKSFGGKTGRDGFEVYQYFFRVPGDATKFAVMWDYNIGLVRITPFFKACKYTKTTPAKALNTNAGLKDLSHSITGGALDAQGYWMPYSCARAICATFCYDIRWALTPIFGPRFILECIPTNDPRFAKFKIDAEIIRTARLEAEAWKTPSMNGAADTNNIPRSVPEKAAAGGGKNLPPRAARPTFRLDSPFSSDTETTYTLPDSALASPQISPKTTYNSLPWVTVNRTQVTSTTNSTPCGSLEKSLLNKPHYGGWRPAAIHDAVVQKIETETTSSGKMNNTHDNRSTNKRQRSISKKPQPESSYQSSQAGYDAERFESESDDTDIVVHPSPKKRARRLHQAPAVTTPTLADIDTMGRSRKYRAEDYRAAQWLLNLSMRDADLAKGPHGFVGPRKK